MALSGSISTTVGSHWKLSISWSATQSIANNTSTVTAKMYWENTDDYGAIYSSATKSGYIKIAGSEYDFSGAGLAGLKANQKKLIYSHSKTIQHDDDGTASFSLDGAFSAEVTLGSTYYDTINLTAKTFTLDTIPRKSTLTSNPDFTAGSNRTATISRYSSSFTHKLYIDIKDTSGNWHNITEMDFSSSQTSKSTNFTTAENTSIFNYLAQRSSADVRWHLYTYSGGDSLGYTEYLGTVSIPDVTTITTFGGQAGADNRVYINQTITMNFDKSNSAFTTDLVITGGSFSKTVTGITGTSYSYTPSSSDQSTLYSSCTGMSMDGNVAVTTKYNGVQVGSVKNVDLDWYVDPSISAPTFTSSGITYKDNNTKTAGVTGDSSYIVQGQSDLLVTIPSANKAVAKNGATMKSYTISVNGVSKSVAYSSSANVTQDMGTISANKNVNLTVTAVDSRGLSTTAYVTVKVLPYSPPSISLDVERENGFDAATDINISGSISPLTIGTTQKNQIQNGSTLNQITYAVKKSTDTSYPTATKLTTTGTPNFSVPQFTITCDSTLTYNVQVTVSDKLTTSTSTATVSVGRPIMFFDPDLKSVGIGDFPDAEYQLKINGSIKFGGTYWNNVGGAMNLNNGDIMGLNGLYFNDTANTNGEGLLFLKSTSTEGSTNPADYDNFRILDGTIYLNGNAFANLVGNKVQLTIGSNIFATNGGGLVLNNSDITGANSLFFADYLNSDGEGFHFPKSTATDVTDVAQCDTLRGLDGKLLFNSNKVLHEGDVQIATGYVSITPTGNNVPTSVNISFTNPFPGDPCVVALPNSGVVGTTVTGIGATAAHSNGFTLWITRTNTSATGAWWIAIYGGSR